MADMSLRSDLGETRAQRARPTDRKARKKHAIKEVKSKDILVTTLLLMMVPAVLVILPSLIGLKLPKIMLYGIAGIAGLIIFIRSFRTPDPMIAAILLYLPFAKIYVVPLAPGVNGTNLLLIGCLVIGYFYTNQGKASFLSRLSGHKIIYTWHIVSMLSVITMIFAGGLSYFLDNARDVKQWIDQILIFFVMTALIHDREIAKRTIIYMMLGAAASVIYAFPELLEKSGLSSIEKSRLLGAFKQPNEFGGFIAYTLMPAIAIAMVYLKNWRAWLLLPYVLYAVKILIATFSRGSLLAFLAGCFLAGYARGKAFLGFWIVVALMGVLMFPQLLPQAVKDRFAQTQAEPTSEKKLDKSSETRFIMWEAALEMTSESPVLGKGFRMFPKLKSQYTSEEVHEADPHSMYMYIMSQMGVPALLIFLGIFYSMYRMGKAISRFAEDPYVRAIGIAGCGTVMAVATTNLLGSRMVNIEYSAYFWSFYVILQVLYTSELNLDTPVKQKKMSGRKPMSKVLQHRIADRLEQQSASDIKPIRKSKRLQHHD